MIGFVWYDYRYEKLKVVVRARRPVVLDLVSKSDICRDDDYKIINEYMSLIPYVARRGELEMLKFIVAYCEEHDLRHHIYKRDEDNETVVPAAAKSGSLELVQYLIQCFVRYGRDEFIFSKGRYGDTILHSAADSGNVELFEYLVEFSEDHAMFSNNPTALQDFIFSESVGSIMYFAVYSQSLDMVMCVAELYERYGRRRHIMDTENCGQTPLGIAAGFKEQSGTDIVRYLCTKIQEVDDMEKLNPTNKYGLPVAPPVHEAANAGNLETVRYLASLGCDLDLPDAQGCTALSLAILREHYDVAEFLIHSGACPTYLIHKFFGLEEYLASDASPIYPSVFHKLYNPFVIECNRHLAFGYHVKYKMPSNLEEAALFKQDSESYFQYASRKGRLACFSSGRSCMYPYVLDALVQDDPQTGNGLLQGYLFEDATTIITESSASSESTGLTEAFYNLNAKLKATNQKPQKHFLTVKRSR